MSTIVTIVVVPITIAVIGVVNHNFEFIIKKLSTLIPALKYKSNFDKVVSAKLYMDSLTKSLEARPNIGKAVLIAITNGGNIAKPEGLLYGTIINPSRYIDTFNKQVIDSDYLRLVQEVYMNKYTKREVKDLEDYSILKNLLLSQGYNETHCFDVKEIATKKTFTYVFLAVDLEEGMKLQPEDNDEIRNVINEVNKLL